MTDTEQMVNKIFRGKMSLIHKEAMVHLCDMAKTAPFGKCVEIGVFKGSSLTALAVIRQGMGEVIGVDDWSYNGFGDLHEQAKDLLKWNDVDATLYGMTSEEAAKVIPGPLAFVHIDGNHTYDFIKKDIEIWTPKIMPGGIVAFHDYGRHRADIQVQQAVDEWQAREPWIPLGNVLTLIGFRKP